MSHELPPPSPDGNFQLGLMCPLRLVKNTKTNIRSVADAGQAIELMGPEFVDSVTMSIFPNIPETVRFSIKDKLSKGYKPFVRDLFYTRCGDRRIMTMTGYLMSEKSIVVVSDYVAKNVEAYSDQLREQVQIARTIELEHVQGFDKAVRRHQEKINDLESIAPIDMHEANETYYSLVYGH